MRQTTENRIGSLENDCIYLRKFMYSMNETLALLTNHLEVTVETIREHKVLMSTINKGKETGK